MHRFAIATLIATSVVCAHAHATTQSLPSEISDVRWNVSSTVFGNFTCRGQQDLALFGISEKSGFVVMVRPARKGAKSSYLVFATRGRDPKSLRLEVESLDFADDEAFKQEIKAAAPGLQPSKTCKGLSFGDGETDAHHIYWNRRQRVVQSWSL